MPPKKALPTMVSNEEAALAKEQSVRDGINVDDFALPKSIVTKLAKGVLPPNTQIQGNAMLAMTKSATVFVNYLASHANEHAHSQNRKTLSTVDVFAALEELEFPDWKEKLEGELAKWHEIQAEKKNNASKKKAAEKGEDGEEETQGENEDSSKLGQPVAKKARLETAQKAGGIERTSLPTRPNTGEHTADEDAGDDEDPADDDEDDDEDEEPEERLEVEGHEDTQEVEAEDEALDNGEDSD